MPQLNSTKTFPVTGMSCSGCSSSIEKILKEKPGIIKAQVNFANKTLLVEYNAGISPLEIKNILNNIGFDLQIEEENAFDTQKDILEKESENLKFQTIWSVVLSFPVFVFGMFMSNWKTGQFISFVLCSIVLVWLGRKFYVNAIKLLRQKSANMDSLVALSTGVAYFFSVFSLFYPQFWLERNLLPHVYFEAATLIIAFVNLGKFIEEKAKSNTSIAIKSLMNLQPDKVLVLKDNFEQELDLKEVEIGMLVLVKPGARIPVDGRVIEGHSFVDESMMTGEPIAVEKEIGKSTFAGTVNLNGRLVIEAENVGENTRLSKIIKTVRDAQGSKAPVQKMVDKIALFFVPTVLFISILTFIVWMIFGGSSYFSHALLSAVSVLVIACPCALGLATPTAIMVGIGKGAENHILIKNAESLEIGDKITTVVLDKTGTLTEGKPKVTDVFYTDTKEFGKIKESIITIESQSDHPLANSITDYFNNVEVDLKTVEKFENLVGRGVFAEHNQSNFLIGNERLLNENKIPIDSSFKQKIELYSSKGKSLVFVACNGVLIALFAISDSIKESAEITVSTLHKMGVNVAMLTGDNYQSAKFIAEECGISTFLAEQLPEDKAKYVKELQKENEIVAMVGDGINDSEALALANMSMAIGQGSDIAKEISNITILSQDLMAIPKAIKLSKLTVKGLKQNLFWAFVYNIIGIPIAAGILYPSFGFLLSPMIASAAMAFSSVSVVLNSLRLNGKRLV